MNEVNGMSLNGHTMDESTPSTRLLATPKYEVPVWCQRCGLEYPMPLDLTRPLPRLDGFICPPCEEEGISG